MYGTRIERKGKKVKSCFVLTFKVFFTRQGLIQETFIKNNQTHYTVLAVGANPYPFKGCQLGWHFVLTTITNKFM